MPYAAHQPRRDLHAEITQKLIAAIEANPGHPQLPWRTSTLPALPKNATTGANYNGINILLLWVAAQLRGFSLPLWASYKQWQSIGAQVRKGAKSEVVVFYKEYTAEPNPDDANDDGTRRVARASLVFNAADVDGFTLPEAPPSLGPIERIANADRFLAATGARIAHGGHRAFYAPSTDHIQMPDEGLFTGTDTMTRSEGYYATLLHEACHWTAPKSRCDRNLSTRFENREVAAEELVAEIGAAMLCAELEITAEPRPDHAQYLANWLELLRHDSRAIFTAAAKASQAVAYLKSLQLDE